MVIFQRTPSPLERVIQALEFKGAQSNWLDPCCGEGSALAEIQHALSTEDTSINTYGVEYNEARAWHAKQLLDHCIHGDLRDCMISARQYGFLFLNPPYGDADFR